MSESRNRGWEKRYRLSCSRLSRSGFTLIEMAVALIVVGLVILAVFPALMAVRSGSQRSLTQSNLQALMTATAAYVQANGCLPCPTPASTFGGGFGHVRGDANTSPLACGTCAIPEGIPPFASLGIPAATAHDGGGHWITMRVDPGLTGSGNFTVIAPPTKTCACTGPANGPCTASSPVCAQFCSIVNSVCTIAQSEANISLQGMCTAGLSTSKGANPIQIVIPPNATPSQYAAVIFVSHGANGYGSFFANALFGARGTGWTLTFPPGTASCAAGGYAECNAASSNGPALFYDAPATVGGNNAYDDMLAFADRNTLVSMLGNGSCQTVW